ncbi:hypothetical protein AB0F77_25205 [Streptomyces sp. NPDC026672]|uniref:hypothetical protein n=1 Tax=unclassified Streptomyces TaxID=2593676 RepID=UPI00340681A8
MTVRRTLGYGPQASALDAVPADLLDSLPGVRLPDLDELRTRGVLGARLAATPAVRRTLGDGTGRPD